MTTKSDGKSSNHTQRPPENDIEEDTNVEDERNRMGPRFYFAVGLLMVVVLFFASIQNITESLLEKERDKTMAEHEKKLESS